MGQVSRWTSAISKWLKNNTQANNKSTKRQIGEQAEAAACKFLRKKGLHLLERNYHCRLGEIDLIMADGEYIVFIEVRYRSQLNYGTPQESVNFAKQRRIVNTAMNYLKRKGLSTQSAMRFDIVAVTKEKQQMAFNWVKNAF